MIATVLSFLIGAECGFMGSAGGVMMLMGAAVEVLPGIVITAACTVGAVISSKFANRVSEKVMNRCAGVVLIIVSIISLFLS